METTLTPVIKEISVPLPPERAFELFTEGIASWWPITTHSISEDAAATCVFEGRVGGRIYEVGPDGKEWFWGEVVVWEPPDRIVYEWNPNPERTARTEVEVTFTSHSDSHTQLRLEHRNWENLGPQAAELRQSYDSGWDPVLSAYLDHA